MINIIIIIDFKIEIIEDQEDFKIIIIKLEEKIINKIIIIIKPKILIIKIMQNKKDKKL